MPTLKVTPESISAALSTDWQLANEGVLTWVQIMGFITTIQDFYRHSGGDLFAPEYEDLQFLWEHALSRI